MVPIRRGFEWTPAQLRECDQNTFAWEQCEQGFILLWITAGPDQVRHSNAGCKASLAKIRLEVLLTDRHQSAVRGVRTGQLFQEIAMQSYIQGLSADMVHPILYLKMRLSMYKKEVMFLHTAFTYIRYEQLRWTGPWAGRCCLEMKVLSGNTGVCSLSVYVSVMLPNQLQPIMILTTTLTTHTQKSHNLLLLSARLLPHALCLSPVNPRATQLAFPLTPHLFRSERLWGSKCSSAQAVHRSCGDGACVSASLEPAMRNKAERAGRGAVAPLGPKQGLMMSEVVCLIQENRMHMGATNTWASLLRSVSEQAAYTVRHAVQAFQMMLCFISESKSGSTLKGRSVRNDSHLSLLLLIVPPVTKLPCPHQADTAETGELAGSAAVRYPQVYLRWGRGKAPASAVPSTGMSRASSREQGHWSMTAACRAARGKCETRAWGGPITHVVTCACICPWTTAECWWEWPSRCEQGMFAASHLKYLHELWLPLRPAGQQVCSLSLPHFSMSYRSEFTSAVTRVVVLMLWIIPVTNYWCQQSYSHSPPQHLPFLSLRHTQQYQIASICIPWLSSLHLASTRKHIHTHNQTTN